jgi:hypothetical protein
MTFVHGHARDTGWVVAHRRKPNRAEDGQLPLTDLEQVIPRPRDPPDAEGGPPPSHGLSPGGGR